MRWPLDLTGCSCNAVAFFYLQALGAVRKRTTWKKNTWCDIASFLFTELWGIYTDYDLFLAPFTVIKQMVQNFLVIQEFYPPFGHARKGRTKTLNPLEFWGVATIKKSNKWASAEGCTFQFPVSTINKGHFWKGTFWKLIFSPLTNFLCSRR